MKKTLLFLGLIGLASLTTSCGTGNYYQPYPPQKPGHPGIGVQPIPISDHGGCDLEPPAYEGCAH